MTDANDLAALPTRDLRQLAGEHQIVNRSRLGRDDLISALQAVIVQHTDSATGAAAALQAAPSPALSSPTVPSADSAAADPTSNAAEPEKPVASPEAEAPATTAATTPVELADATAVATMAVAAEAPAAVPAGEPELLDASVLGLAEPEVLDPGAIAGDPGQSGGEGVQVVLGEDGQPVGERRRRRRRRRGRGRGRAEDGQPQVGEGEGDEESGDEDGDESVQAAPATVATAATPPAAPTPAEPAASPSPANETSPVAVTTAPAAEPAVLADSSNRPGSPGPSAPRSVQAGTAANAPSPAPAQVVTEGPRRPRIEGLVRPVGSVLDRLKSFCSGILDLCDPTTPSWAQPRLAELLAEAGCVPMPSQGLPHPEYHRVVGTLAGTQVSAGHIAEILAPGFAIRGDRGDLFCLRKAQVRVAGRTSELFAPGATPAAPAAGSVMAPAAETRAPRFDPSSRGATARTDSPLPVAAPQRTEAPPQTETVPQAGASPRADAPARADAPVPMEAPRSANEPIAAGPGGPEARRDGDQRRDGRHERGRNRQPREDRHQPPAADLPAGESPAQAEPTAAPMPPAEGRPAHQPPRGREPATIAPSLPLAPQVPEELAQRPKAEAFRVLGLNDQILADLATMGYKEPTPIQTQAIPVAVAGRDAIGQAQTGTGKTAAFVLPMLQRLYASAPREAGSSPFALVMCPTRELARQVHDQFMKMAGASGARAALIYGGVSYEDQFHALERRPHVVIGTPGRIIDHLKRHTFDPSKLELVVLDEADQMLDIGFWPDIQYVLGHTPPSRQILLFSATFPDAIKELAARHMKDVSHIHIEPAKVTVDQVDQKYIAVPHDKKTSLLAHFIETQNPERMIVFCHTKHQTDRVAEVLKRKNMSAAAIHGDLPQSRRERALKDFREGQLQCLIATNVAARGIDIPTVSHVVNYDIPEMPEEYVHRIGRTARNGAKGVARTFITPEDGQFLLEIEKHIGLLLEEEVIEGFTPAHVPQSEIKRTIADTPVGTPRLLKPLVGGIRLGRRR